MSGLVDVIDDFDPNELQDGLLKDIDNVHERLAEARERHPIMAGNPFTETHTDNTPPVGFTVLSHELVSEVLSDPERFATHLYADIMGVVMGPTMLQMDGPAHRAHRLLATPAFRQKMLDRWRIELVEVVCDELISSFEGRGHAEAAALREYFKPILDARRREPQDELN